MISYDLLTGSFRRSRQSQQQSGRHFLQPPRETSKAPAYREFNLYYNPEQIAEWVHAVRNDVIGDDAGNRYAANMGPADAGSAKSRK